MINQSIKIVNNFKVSSVDNFSGKNKGSSTERFIDEPL